MSLRDLLILLLLGIVVALIASMWVDVPGYMDAEYYYSTGVSLTRGLGFREPFIWNYLNDPSGIPVPSHQYWMPATSILSGISMSIFDPDFKSAQIPFIVLTGLIAPATALLAYGFHKDRKTAILSGLFAISSGFFLPFLVTTDTFAIYMLIGAGTLWYMSQAIERKHDWFWVVAGLFAGLAHLSRVDGVLLLLVAFLSILFSSKGRIKDSAYLLLGYLAVMLPWWIHSYRITGALLSTGSAKTLWSLSYDELFSYPAERLSFQRWLNAGVGEIIRVRAEALVQNFKTLLLVNGLVFLAPLMTIAALRHRERALVRLSLGYLVLLLLVMSLVFPFAGARGGFFHSSSAVMPVLWILAPMGLFQAIDFGVQKRNWDRSGARTVFSVSSVGLALLTTVGIFHVRVIGSLPSATIWSSSHSAYQAVDRWFQNSDQEDGLVAINNPPGFFVASGRRSVVIPDGGTQALRKVVERYDVEWVVLDANNPGLAGLYEDPTSVPWLQLEGTLDLKQGSRIKIFKVTLD